MCSATRLLTGRAHQIRVHLRHAGFPIVRDELYGGKRLWLSRIKRDYRLKPAHEERPLISRVALHAESLELTFPAANEIGTINAELLPDVSRTA